MTNTTRRKEKGRRKKKNKRETKKQQELDQNNLKTGRKPFSIEWLKSCVTSTVNSENWSQSLKIEMANLEQETKQMEERLKQLRLKVAEEKLRWETLPYAAFLLVVVSLRVSCFYRTRSDGTHWRVSLSSAESISVFSRACLFYRVHEFLETVIKMKIMLNGCVFRVLRLESSFSCSSCCWDSAA